MTENAYLVGLRLSGRKVVVVGGGTVAQRRLPLLLANGADVPELETTFYGMTEFRIDDPDGNRLWIGQKVATQG